MKRLVPCLVLLLAGCSTTSSIVPDPIRVARFRAAAEPLRVEITKDLAAGIPWVQVAAATIAAVGLAAAEPAVEVPAAAPAVVPASRPSR